MRYIGIALGLLAAGLWYMTGRDDERTKEGEVLLWRFVCASDERLDDLRAEAVDFFEEYWKE